MEALLAIALLVVLAPLLLLTAALVTVTSPGGPLFAQERVGQGGALFRMLKFRTMRLADGAGITARGDSRVTAMGKLLRATKLDELPELVHVVRGQMSFVGPRPEVPRYVDLECPLWQEVLRARPGLTDPATLRLRDEEELLALLEGDLDERYRDTLLPWKLRCSAAYLARRTAWSDVRVLTATAWRVMAPGRETPATLLAEIQAARENH